MKYYTLFIAFFMAASIGFAQDPLIEEDSLSTEDILGANFESYIGKNVQELLISNYVNGFEKYVFIDDKPGALNGVSLQLTDSISLDILVDEFQYLEPINMYGNWDFSLFKKETISRIVINVNDRPFKEW